jgi:hypothetical protein
MSHDHPAARRASARLRSGSSKGALGALLAATACCGLTAAPARAGDIIPPKVLVTTPGGVNVADGSFVYAVTDFAIGPLTLERSHVTGVTKPRRLFFGTNMTHNFDMYAYSNKSNSNQSASPVIHVGSDASGLYTQHSTTLSAIYDLNDDARSGILEWAGQNNWTAGYYVFTDASGTVYTFNPSVSVAGIPASGLSHSQRIAQITFPDGRAQSFSYNSSQQLKLVSDSSGYAIVFDYNSAGDVSAACGFNTATTYVSASSTCSGATLKTTYGYDSSRNLTSVVDVKGQTTTYPGNMSVGITCIQPTGYATCKIANTYVDGRVTQQTMADGAVWTTASGPEYVNDPELTVTQDGENVGGITDPAGKGTTIRFTKTSPYEMTDANGNVTNYRFRGGRPYTYVGPNYSDGKMLVEAVLPEGNKYLAEYGGPFNGVTKETLVAKPGTGLANLVEERGYGSCSSPGTRQNCGKPIWLKDAKGNQTDFTYAAHGGVLTEMRPAPTSGAARPLKVYTYLQKYAWVKNSGGTLVQAASPVWLPASETVCQTAANSSTPVCDSSAQQMVTTFEYGADGTANSLRLRGKVVTSGGVSRRSCVSYDDVGNAISGTSARAALTSCP